MILEAGIDRVRERNAELSAYVIERASSLGLEVCSPLDSARRGGLVRVRLPGGREKAEATLHALFERDVVLDTRGDCLRISPHFFNDHSDVDRCFEELAKLL